MKNVAPPGAEGSMAKCARIGPVSGQQQRHAIISVIEQELGHRCELHGAAADTVHKYNRFGVTGAKGIFKMIVEGNNFLLFMLVKDLARPEGLEPTAS